MALTAELLERGATLLQEPCPRCGSVQIKYKSKIYCTNEDDLQALLNPGSEKEPSPSARIEVPQNVRPVSPATDNLRKLMEEKLGELSKQLDATTDPAEQARLLDLISKYLETLEKIKRASA